MFNNIIKRYFTFTSDNVCSPFQAYYYLLTSDVCKQGNDIKREEYIIIVNARTFNFIDKLETIINEIWAMEWIFSNLDIKILQVCM